VLGAQTERLLNGQPATDMGPPTGRAAAETNLLLDRVSTSLVFSMGGAFTGTGPFAGEAIALARLACEVGNEAPEAEVCRSVLAALDVVDQLGGPEELGRGKPALGALLMALCVACTPNAPLPPAPGFADVAERTA
jgi:hypothetical protein